MRLNLTNEQKRDLMQLLGIETVTTPEPPKPHPKKRRMKTGKKAFYVAFMLCILMLVFSAVMVYLDKDTATVGIFAGSGVICITVLFNIYEKGSNEITKIHMEKNYNPNYDEEEGIY